MEAITVTSVPLKEVVTEIGESWNVPIYENCGEYSIKIPKHLGSGKISGVNFKDGLGHIQYDCTFKTDVEIRFVVNEIHPLKFIYMLDGSLIHRFENDDVNHLIEQYQHCIVASERCNGHILKFKGKTRHLVNSLEINRKPFGVKMACELRGLSEKLKCLFLDIHAKKSFYFKGYYSLKIADLFQEMVLFENEDFIRKLFMEGIVYQMLTQEIIQFQDELKDKGEQTMLTRYEMNSIKEAAFIIENHISNNNSIEKLSRKVGLNCNKLQYGFQQLYGLTVHGYIKKKRLEIAKTLLLKTDLQVSEIVDRIGLQSRSYFSRIFRENYKVTPKQFRLKNRIIHT